MSKFPVSVIIPVLNEEKNLPDCLASVAWADEVFVVDSGSTDATCRVAEEHGAKVVQFRFQPGGPRKKNWALDNLPLRNEWVLLLDADERITPELHAEIEQVFADGPKHEGYYVCWKLVFMGRWIRHGGNFPCWAMRLFRRPFARYEQLGTENLAAAGDVEVHEHMLLRGSAGYFKAPMLHLDYKDLSAWIDRHNRYSTWDAKVRRNLLDGKEFSSAIPARLFGAPIERKRFLKRLWVRLPCRPLLRFLYMYVFRLGFLDGRAGFIYAVLKAIHEFHISAKMYEMQARQPREENQAC